jgi:hypothetical protein
MNTTSRRASAQSKIRSRAGSAFVPGKTSMDDPDSLKNEMLYRLEEYKRELKVSIDEQKPLKDGTFKKNFYNALENMLNRILLMRHDGDRTLKVKELFRWFKGRSEFYYGVNNITKRTDKYHYEKYPNVDTTRKTEYFAAKNFPQAYERDNRTEEEGLQPPKDKYIEVI